MPPIVPQENSDSPSRRELHRALSTVLRVQCEQGMSPEVLEANKIVGNHLLLAKRSSYHPTLSATNSLVSQNSAEMIVSAVEQSNLADNNGFAMQVARKALVMSNLHRPLDRSLSEPVWQQQKQPQEQKQTNSSRYKTELCRPFEENGFCKYGDKCQFAHGGNELRSLNRHPKYKTELCRTFHTIGICPYGPRCHFIHNAEESRLYANVLLSAGQSPPPELMHPQQTHASLAMTQSLGLSNLADSKLSPLNSIHGSPTSPGVFFDEAGSFVFPPNLLLENLAETLASSLQLNNKLSGPDGNNFSTQLTNQLNTNLSKQNTDIVMLPSTMDTPPASPPESSVSPSSSVGEDKSSLRLPVFQSINTW